MGPSRNMLHLVYASILYYLLSEVNCKNEGKSTLRLLQIVFRHGERTPINSFPTDPYNNDSYWPEGWGQLTNQGKLQQYHLGRYLRNRYKDFLTQNPLEVQVRSSGVPRCLDSAACNLASLYVPEGRWIWNTDLKWQPIPIQTMPPAQDGLLFPQADCPEAVKEHQRIVESAEGQQFLEDHKTMLTYASKHCGCDLPDWRKANWLYDTLKIEKQFGLELPDWTKSIWKELQYVADLSFYWDYKSKQIQRLRAGLLIQEISKNLQSTNRQRLFVYSTHDTMLAAVLSGWGVFNKLPPPYCATILIELHEHDPGNFTVRLLYKNETDTTTPPLVLILPKCQEYCPLGHYLHHVRDVIPEDWRAECGLEQPKTAFSPQARVAVICLGSIIVVLIVVSLIMAWYLCRKTDDPVFYHRVPTN